MNRHSQALPLIVDVDDGIQKQKEGAGMEMCLGVEMTT